MLNFFKKNLTEEQLQQINQAAEKFKKNPHQFRFTVIFFITSILFGGLTIYLLQQKFALMLQKNGKVEIKEIIKNIPVPAPEVTLEPTKEATTAAQVRSTSWTLEQNGCAVLLPISPYQETYEVADKKITRIWQSSNLKLGNDFPEAFLNVFDQISIADFSAKNLETGSTPASVLVYCADNQGKTSLADLRNEIERQLATKESLQGISILSSLEKKTWGKDSLELVFSGGNLDGKIFYATVTSKHFYLVTKQVNLNDETVKQDSERIFNGLIFLD